MSGRPRVNTGELVNKDVCLRFIQQVALGLEGSYSYVVLLLCLDVIQKKLGVVIGEAVLNSVVEVGRPLCLPELPLAFFFDLA